MVSRFPPCLPTGAHPLHTPFRCGHLFLVGCCVSCCRSAAVQRQQCISYFNFLPLDLPPPNDYTASPPHVPPWLRLFYNDPLIADTNFWLVVAFNIRTVATLGQDPIPLSNFLMGCVLVPQAREPAAAITNPPLGTCCGPLGSCGTKIWGRQCPTYGERGQSR
jgi:hypothetical protein